MPHESPFFKQYPGRFYNAFLFDPRGTPDVVAGKKKNAWITFLALVLPLIACVLYDMAPASWGWEIPGLIRYLPAICAVSLILSLLALGRLTNMYHGSDRVLVDPDRSRLVLGKKNIIPFGDVEKIVILCQIYPGESTGEKRPGESAVLIQIPGSSGGDLVKVGDFDDIQTARAFADEINRFLKKEILTREIPDQQEENAD